MKKEKDKEELGFDEIVEKVCKKVEGNPILLEDLKSLIVWHDPPRRQGRKPFRIAEILGCVFEAFFMNQSTNIEVRSEALINYRRSVNEKKSSLASPKDDKKRVKVIDDCLKEYLEVHFLHFLHQQK
jgi:hypothetical protein